MQMKKYEKLDNMCEFAMDFFHDIVIFETYNMFVSFA